MTALPHPATVPLSAPRLLPPFAALAILIALAALPLLLAAVLDPRQIGGEGVWIKPLKFHAALVVYLGTLAVFARWLPPGLTDRRWWHVYAAVVSACVVAELLWIGGAAFLGVASHFNTTSAFWSATYGVMGVLAVTLTSAALVMGVILWRAGTLPPVWREAIGLGLVLTFVLTVITAGTMAGGTGHHVGAPVSGLRVPLMGWSREVGDLRLAHFLATHALHAVPLAGFTGSRVAVRVAAAGWTALTLGAFALALAGRAPF
jgi:hypothetical protein